MTHRGGENGMMSTGKSTNRADKCTHRKERHIGGKNVGHRSNIIQYWLGRELLTITVTLKRDEKKGIQKAIM